MGSWPAGEVEGFPKPREEPIYSYEMQGNDKSQISKYMQNMDRSLFKIKWCKGGSCKSFVNAFKELFRRTIVSHLGCDGSKIKSL